MPEPETRWAYLTIIQWPDRCTEDQAIEALVASAAMEPYYANQAVKRGVPQVILRLDALVIPEVMAELKRRGVMAFCPLEAEIEALDSKRRLKRLVPSGARLKCEFWRDNETTILFDDIKVIVYAVAKDVTTRTSANSSDNIDLGRVSRATQFGGAYAGAHAALNEYQNVGANRLSNVKLDYILDLYTNSGERLRAAGSKFNYDILGDDKGFSDAENSRKLFDYLKSKTPHAIHDDHGFNDFKHPPSIQTKRTITSGRSSSMQKTDTSSALDFYSAWTFLLYKHLGAFE